MRGRAIPLSPARRLVADMMHFAAGFPTVPVQRRMNLGPVLAARRGLADRPPWPAIFAKAFALTATEFPELRRVYVKLPWPHLYEYPLSVANITVERVIGGEPVVLSLLTRDPARVPLSEFGARVREAATGPIESIKPFRKALGLARVPFPFRRLLWWLGLNLGRQRGGRFGTFAVSVYSGLGAESLHPRSIWTALLNYGVIADDCTVDVRIVYDHRVMDGATVARALGRMEQVLNGSIRDELIGTATAQAA